MAKALTVKAIEQLRPGPARREIPDGLLAGLYLIVQPSGVKSWAVRYRFKQQPKKLTIGSYPGIDLGSARALARRAVVALAEGRDPAAEKKASRRASSDDASGKRDVIETVVATYLERHAKPNTRDSTWRETERLMNKEVVALGAGAGC
jgi:hypothetical protein